MQPPAAAVQNSMLEKERHPRIDFNMGAVLGRGEFGGFASTFECRQRQAITGAAQAKRDH